MNRVRTLASKLKHIDIIGGSVGLRPGRDAVRLELEYFRDKAVIHNYGHGGSGFTLSWGLCPRSRNDNKYSLY